MSKPLAIIGSGRSGTSYVIKTLNQNGVPVGNCTPGTMENLTVREINDGYLLDNFNGKNRSGTPYGKLPDEEIKVTNSSIISKVNDFVDLMNNRYSEAPFWAFKDPRTTLLHDLWIPHCEMAIAVFRHPQEVIESYTKLLGGYYNDLDECREVMANYWIRFNKSLIYAVRNYMIPIVIIEFNEDIHYNLNNVFTGNLKEEIPNTKTNKNDGTFYNETIENLYKKLQKMAIKRITE